MVDKFRDQLPQKMWPALRYFFYVLAVAFVAVELAGAFTLYLHPSQGTPPTPPDAVVSPQ
jgi:fatty acid desaturase